VQLVPQNAASQGSIPGLSFESRFAEGLSTTCSWERGWGAEGKELSNPGGTNCIFLVQFSDRLSGMPTNPRSSSSSPGSCFAAPAADLGLPGGQQHCLHWGTPLGSAACVWAVVLREQGNHLLSSGNKPDTSSCSAWAKYLPRRDQRVEGDQNRLALQSPFCKAFLPHENPFL